MRLAYAGLLLLAVAACEAPPVSAGADRRQNSRSGRIEGTVVASTGARGNALIFLFDAAHPPPPEGTGRPLSFSVVTSEQLFAGAAPTDTGPFSAPFAFSLVAPGRYLVRGFIDAHSDFVPWYLVTDEPKAGDVAGAAVDAATGTLRIVEVAQDRAGQPMAATGVPVSFSDAAKVPVDRPAFEVDVASLELRGGPATIELTAKPLAGAQVKEPLPAFLAQLVDANGDGMTDDADGDGYPDFWPQVRVAKLSGVSLAIDENPRVILKSHVELSTLMPQLLDDQKRVKVAPTPMTHLSLVIEPLAIDVSDPQSPRVLAAIPPGRYAITVIQSTGQTWQLPNELDPSLAGTRGFPALNSQSFVVQVP